MAEAAFRSGVLGVKVKAGGLEGLNGEGAESSVLAGLNVKTLRGASDAVLFVADFADSSDVSAGFSGKSAGFAVCCANVTGLNALFVCSGSDAFAELDATNENG